MPRGEMMAADTGLDGIEADESDDDLGEDRRLAGAGRSHTRAIAGGWRRDHRARGALVGALLLLLAAPAAAQSVEKWTLRIYATGAATPLTAPTDLLAATVVCGQPAPPVTATSLNPTKVIFDDPATPGSVCIWTDPGTGPLSALPFGATAYQATVTATNSLGTSGESNRASFTHPGQIPGVPTGTRVIR
jgi:hypothetical protein